MELSIFLAKLLGLYFLIMAAAWIIRRDQIDKSIKDFSSSRGLIFLSGVINTLLGLAIVIGHPVLQFNWMGLITFLGFLMLFGGIMRITFAEKLQKHMLNIIDKGYWPCIAVLVVLGAILTYYGFYGWMNLM